MAHAETKEPAFTRVTEIAGQAAIVPMKNPHISLLRILCGHSNAPTFTPTQDEVRKAEATLVPYLQKNVPPRAAMIWQKADEYRRQYGGVIVELGTAAGKTKGKEPRRKLIVNASCRDSSQDWLNMIVAVKDGGSCYYQLTYDLTTATWSDLRINGEG